jgi:hypothetical protein
MAAMEVVPRVVVMEVEVVDMEVVAAVSQSWQHLLVINYILIIRQRILWRRWWLLWR